MKLRDCPLIKWPTTWTKTEGPDHINLKSELGILKSIVPSRTEPATRFYLMMQLSGAWYIGTLVFEDGKVARQVIDLLQQHSDHSIQQLGDLDWTCPLNKSDSRKVG